MSERLDPSQIAGSREWVARVEAEARGSLARGLRGVGRVDEEIDLHAAAVGEPRFGDVKVELVDANQPLLGQRSRRPTMPIDDNPGRGNQG